VTLGYGNCFVTAAILVRLPFCSREIGLPVLARLHLPGKSAWPGKVETAAALISPHPSPPSSQPGKQPSHNYEISVTVEGPS
jgi:hypothetical protein